MSRSLYERLGGQPAIAGIIDEVFALHLDNPLIRSRFEHIDLAKVKGHAVDFFCMGSGGPQSYQGRDMHSAHQGLNISEQEFVAALDDILMALDRHGVGLAEKNEVLGILYSMKSEILRV